MRAGTACLIDCLFDNMLTTSTREEKESVHNIYQILERYIRGLSLTGKKLAVRMVAK